MIKINTPTEEQYGILIYISTLFAFAAMEAQAKYLTTNFSVIQIVWARYTFHFVLIALIFLLLKIIGYKINIKKPKLLNIQILRSVSLLLMTFFFFASLSISEVAVCFAANPDHSKA